MHPPQNPVVSSSLADGDIHPPSRQFNPERNPICLLYTSGKDDFLVDVARTVCNAKEVKRVMVIPNSEDGDAYDRLREILRKVCLLYTSDM